MIEKWINPGIEILKKEITALSLKINLLEVTLNDIEKTIYEFQIRHTSELGEIVSGIFEKKTRIAEFKASGQPANEAAQQEFFEAKAEDDEYRGQHERVVEKPLFVLKEEQRIEIKRKFRKIAALAHPDKVDAKYKDRATEIFIKAKFAMNNNDLETINKIYEYIETDKPFILKSEIVMVAEELLIEIKHWKFVISETENNIQELRQTETYKLIKEISNWDDYFMDAKRQLLNELFFLENSN